jgi:sugar diacid utilization regulator
MVGAVLAGEGLERIAEIAADHIGAPVAVIVPSTGETVEAWSAYERYVQARLGGNRPERPAGVVAEVPIASGGRQLGAVLQLGPGPANAGEFLHMAAIAALTKVAVVEARDETEQSLRGSLVEELLSGERIEDADVIRRARRMGADLTGGAVALCADPGDRTASRLLAVISAERPDALAQAVGDRVYVLLPGSVDDAEKLAWRLRTQATVGISARYAKPGDLGQALEEAELVLDVDEVRTFYDETIAPLVQHDREYSTDLITTLDTYLAGDCNVREAAHALHIQPHTVNYRLDRMRELSGLDPTRSEDRDRLALGLKAYRIAASSLPR